MKKIVIDCRYIGMSGIGRVLEGFITNLPSDNDFYFLGSKQKLKEYGIENNIIEDDNYPVSKKGLFVTKEINKYDAFFTPNFIIPYHVKIDTYTMIHDLMFLDFKDTTNGFVDKVIKKHFYKRCIKKSKGIFTVSNFTKERIMHYYPKCKANIILVYNGLSNSIIEYKKNNPKVTKEDYILFVGNIKKQKGIKTLLEAIDNTDIKLYLVGEKDRFRTKDDTLTKYMDNPNIKFTGRISDEELFNYLAKAKFLIQPSLYEGFGLPPLEALYLETKPIISNIDVFKEIYSNLDVEFFEAGNKDSLLEKIKSTNPIVDKNKNTDEKYSYKKGIETIVESIK